MKALFARLGKTLVPCDAEAEAFLARLKDGRQVMMEYHAPRSPQHHRLLMALLQKMVDNIEGVDDIDQALLNLKMATHLYTAHVTDQGRVVYVPQSIAFASMDQEKFGRFFDRALRVVCDRWLGVEQEALRKEVEAMVGDPIQRKGRK